MTNVQRQQPSGSFRPVFADANGNTFLIFDFLYDAPTKREWEIIKNEAWNQLKQAGVDDALVLEKVCDRKDILELIMHVIEPDKTEAEFCGNGARAVGEYLYTTYGERYRKFFLRTKKGKHALVHQNNQIWVEMKNPLLSPQSYSLPFEAETILFRFVDCVEPHLVTNDFFDFETLQKVGEMINIHWKEHFPHGVNVNCFRQIDNQRIAVITFERGLYRITQSCGTGSTSCCVAAIEQNMIPLNEKIIIEVPGGELILSRKKEGYWLSGQVTLMDS